MTQRVAFIGLGIMGSSMAGHLLAAGNELTVYTRTMSKARELIARGAKGAQSPREAAEGADVVFICVTDTPDVEAVILGKDGLIHAGVGASSSSHTTNESISQDNQKTLKIVVDHSTISPAATRSMAQKLAEKGIALIDAPVSGGDSGARAATLSIMAGGEAAAFEKVLPLLSLMGKTITHCGPSGSGQLTKLVNQILVSVNNLAVCEALSFAKKNGLDLTKTLAAVGGGAAGSWQLANLGPRMVAGDNKPGFMIDLQQKDLRLVLEAAGQASSPLPAVGLVQQLFCAAQAAGRGREGTQALFTVLKNLGAG